VFKKQNVVNKVISLQKGDAVEFISKIFNWVSISRNSMYRQFLNLPAMLLGEKLKGYSKSRESQQTED